MDEGSDSLIGSWSQRNSTLDSTISDMLDLSKSGTDLGILDVFEENNGVALYKILNERLREVKTTDPMARAIRLKMGLDHIKYIVKSHGVTSYFAAIKEHILRSNNTVGSGSCVEEVGESVFNSGDSRCMWTQT